MSLCPKFNGQSRVKLLQPSFSVYLKIEDNQRMFRQLFFFIAPPLKIRFSVPVERVETATFNGLKIVVSTRSTVTANQILKRVAMKNSIHYSKQNTAKAFCVIAALVSLGQQTSHSCNRSVSPLVM